MLAKEPEMLQTDAFCEHTMQQNQNATAVGLRRKQCCIGYGLAKGESNGHVTDDVA